MKKRFCNIFFVGLSNNQKFSFVTKFLFVSKYFGNGFLKDAITIINGASSRNIHIPATNDV